MPEITITASTNAAQRLVDALIIEQPNLQGATPTEKSEAVRQKIIEQLKNWVKNMERIQAEREIYSSITDPDIT